MCEEEAILQCLDCEAYAPESKKIKHKKGCPVMPFP